MQTGRVQTEQRDIAGHPLRPHVCYLAPVKRPDPRIFPANRQVPVFAVVAEADLSEATLRGEEWKWGRVEVKWRDPKDPTGITYTITTLPEFTAGGIHRLKKRARPMLRDWEASNPGHPEAEAWLLIATQVGHDSTDLWWFPSVDSAKGLPHGKGNLLYDIQTMAAEDFLARLTDAPRNGTVVIDTKPGR